MVAQKLSFDELVGPRLTLIESLRPASERIQFYPHPLATQGLLQQRAIREHIAVIASKIERRIPLPNRPLLMEEEQFIAFARTALEHGEASLTWDDMTLPVGPEQARKILDDFSGGVVRSLWLSRAEGERFILFGVVLPLGDTQFILPQAKLMNEQEVRRRLAHKPAGNETVHLRFTADQIPTTIFRYKDWLPGGKYQTRASVPPHGNAPEFKQLIVREFPSRWEIQVSLERRALADILSVPVLAALEKLDRDERMRVLDAMTVLWGWRHESNPDWIVRRIDGNETIFLVELPIDIGLVIRQDQRREQRITTILEIVRPTSLFGSTDDH